MTFKKYKVKDDAGGQLLAWISSVATSVVLKAWEGANFPSYGAGETSIGTLIAYDVDGNVTKKERVTITARSSDSVTVTRGYSSDTPVAFSANDYLFIYATAEVIEDIQNEVESLETTKLDSAGELRTGNWAWKVSHTNADGDEVELWLGASGTVLTSNWASVAPSFDTIEASTKQLVRDFTAWEDLTAWDTLYQDSSDNKVYKTDATNLDKVWLIWIAQADIATDWVVSVAIGGIDTNQSSLTVWEKYFLGAYSTWPNIENTTSLNNTWSTAYIGYSSSSGTKWGQTFTLSARTKLNNITLKVSKNNSPTDNLVLKIYNSPWWTLLYTSPTTIAGGTLTSSYSTEVFSLWGTVFSSGTYFVELERSGSLSTSNYFRWDWTSASPYAWGNFYAFYSSSWNSVSSYDRYFVITTETLVWTWISTSWEHLIWVWISSTELAIINNSSTISWTLATSATTWVLTLWDAEWYVTVNINWTNKKIPYYWL